MRLSVIETRVKSDKVRKVNLSSLMIVKRGDFSQTHALIPSQVIFISFFQPSQVIITMLFVELEHRYD